MREFQFRSSPTKTKSVIQVKPRHASKLDPEAMSKSE